MIVGRDCFTRDDKLPDIMQGVCSPLDSILDSIRMTGTNGQDDHHRDHSFMPCITSYRSLVFRRRHPVMMRKKSQ